MDLGWRPFRRTLVFACLAFCCAVLLCRHRRVCIPPPPLSSAAAAAVFMLRHREFELNPCVEATSIAAGALSSLRRCNRSRFGARAWPPTCAGLLPPSDPTRDWMLDGWGKELVMVSSGRNSQARGTARQTRKVSALGFTYQSIKFLCMCAYVRYQ